MPGSEGKEPPDPAERRRPPWVWSRRPSNWYTPERLLSTPQATIYGMKALPAYTNQLHDLELVDLIDAANRVREIQGHPGWTLIKGLLEVQEERLKNQMLNAALPSYEQMSRLAGEMAGLRAMREAAESVLAYAEERQAEARQALEIGAEEG